MKFRFYCLWLLAACVLAFIIQIMIPGFTGLFDLERAYWFEIWRFLTSIFLHGGVAHLFYNMFALALFGIMLERLVGSKRFLVVFFTTGILANVIAINFYDSSLGASGAIMGVIGALILVRPGLMIFAFGMPMPIFVAGILWAVGDFLGAYGYLTGNPLDNTGNIAHLVGMGVGLILGAVYRDWSRKKEYRAGVRIDENSARRWEDYYMRQG